jgi:hypothetical protein
MRRAAQNGRTCGSPACDGVPTVCPEPGSHGEVSASRRSQPPESVMNMQIAIAPIIALIAGILILVRPRLLNYIVAIYLIVIGLLGLTGAAGMSLR